jgi:hypothetical protein
LRPASGKTDCIFLDHAGAVYRHGLPSDDIAWTLEVDSRAENITAAARKRSAAVQIAACPECSAILGGPPPCWSCGWQPRPRSRDVEFADGELGLVANGKALSAPMSHAQQIQFYREVRGFAQWRGKKDGWAYYACKAKGIDAPWSWRSYEPLPPSPAVAAWCTSRLIAYAKARATEVAA